MVLVTLITEIDGITSIMVGIRHIAIGMTTILVGDLIRIMETIITHITIGATLITIMALIMVIRIIPKIILIIRAEEVLTTITVQIQWVVLLVEHRYKVRLQITRIEIHTQEIQVRQPTIEFHALLLRIKTF
jgi:hypothetical protein